MLLRSGCQLFSPAEKELITGQIEKKTLRCAGILEIQMSKTAGLTNKKACLSFS